METTPLEWATLAVSVLLALGASSGFWTYMMRRDTKKDAVTTLLLGLAHDRIIFLGMQYIERGWVSEDEYEDFVKYLYTPYSEFGGNGLAEKVMGEVGCLPIRGGDRSAIELRER